MTALDPHGPPPPSTDIHIDQLWYTRCPVATASSIAINRGLFDAEFGPDQISVSSLRASTDAHVRQSHFDHQQPNSFRQGGNVPAIWARSQGYDVRLIGASWGERFQAIVALPESGPQSEHDLPGRRLSLPWRLNDQIDFRQATSLRAYIAALTTIGSTLAEVELVDIPVAETYIGDNDATRDGTLFTPKKLRRLQAAEVFALIRGQVDAIYVSGALGLELVALLDAVIAADISSYQPNLQVNNVTPTVLTVSGNLLEARPDLVARYVAVVMRAARWAEKNRAEAFRVIAQEVGSVEDWIPEAHGEDANRHLTPDLGPDLVAAVVSQKDFLLEHGFIQHDVDVEEWLDRGPLAEARQLVDEKGGW